eukprot:CAMPEP_0179335768 /NCGR_PEP_ID=MMETSP0797-20121207/66672_1 /TAXON_ID=47934 /ORGANISM="Dinophysis acuminata, Strain DAEP01" /LENGTH=664 /DNA_ID=CAMNT_0021049183 /DNA_START=1 /DNA_END=1995 /DNA_ORIENTATION=-
MHDTGALGATLAKGADATPAQIFDGLRDFKSTMRSSALECLRTSLVAGRCSPEEVEPLISEALRAEAWEAKQGGLLAAAEAIKVWDRPGFREAMLGEVPRLLVDAEYRVRKAVAEVLRECCRHEGLAVYDRMKDTVLSDISDKFKRTEEAAEEEPEAPPAPPKFLPDTEGWRSLETSMGALEAMMQGCGTGFTSRISGVMLDLMADCSKHTNRFVREYAYFALKNIFDVCDAAAFAEKVAPMTVGLVGCGIRDNWSQVRYAASTAVRAFMQKATETSRERFYPQLLGPMCLNRHYVAEGVRLYSHETWRYVCGPQGGARLLVAHFDSVISAFVEAAEAPNHAVREAASHCISELASKLAGSPEKPSPHRDAFTHVRVQRLLESLMGSFQDESWPVRDVASSALGYFVAAFPLDCQAHRPQLLQLWAEQMADNIPSLRANGAAALAMAMGVWSAEMWDEVLAHLTTRLPEVLQQAEKSETFTDYTPSGPFSVPRAKPKFSITDVSDPEHTDQTMYSCGSIAPKTFKRREKKKLASSAAGGCMNCAVDLPHQLWEASEGMVHLLAELAALVARSRSHLSPGRLDALAALLPTLAQAFNCSQFRHHYLLKQRICERLPALAENLGWERFKPHLPELLRITQQCADQNEHRALRECARVVLTAWQPQL